MWFSERIWYHCIKIQPSHLAATFVMCFCTIECSVDSYAPTEYGVGYYFFYTEHGIEWDQSYNMDRGKMIHIAGWCSLNSYSHARGIRNVTLLWHEKYRNMVKCTHSKWKNMPTYENAHSFGSIIQIRSTYEIYAIVRIHRNA